jgi:hypothetical protein
MTCWRRRRDGYPAGVWRLHPVLLAELAQADRIDWDRAALDSAPVPAPGPRNGQEPRGSRQTGHKAPSCSRRPRHPARSWCAPLRATTRGRPRRRPPKLPAAQGYADRPRQLALLQRRSIPRLARGGVAPKNRRRRYRWGVDRTLSGLNRCRRRKIRHRTGLPSLGPSGRWAAPSSPGVSAANPVPLARTVGLDRRARSLLY